ncbi:type I restriction endonuclease subunit R [Endozoicomonas numazuensis]|uniref:Type I restriction enzyme endonuclease subunit n=1 Tax=Endozoicomonas numazuensis TaxID=1137799 RepID=A0A081NJ45_9GAMM|nr:type I restriction endonuclease subunit R [Endozoicomonas numazuensis]KEQ18468.1 restriction endonuclease subunit R [Endozoicomonas numazuensis]
MSTVGQKERATLDRVVRLFQDHLNYDYLGSWESRENNRNIEEGLLTTFLSRQGYNDVLINKALWVLNKEAALGEGKNLYDANKAVYRLLRYGVKVKEGTGEQNQTVWLIDWTTPENNRFAIAEEVSIKGVNNKRPDIVIYVNGIALGVLELKRSKVSIGEGIRQNLDNQKKDFIRNFYATQQLVMAGNDTEGLRYGTIETQEKYYLSWKEQNPSWTPKLADEDKFLSGDGCNRSDNPLDCALLRLCDKKRFLELIHDFIVFDAGVKKTCRQNQYFGVQAAKKRIAHRDGGIIWHTQGSGKSLTMVWLAKWIKENINDSRVIIITDRTELDEQIQKVFNGVDEDIFRAPSGETLISTLNDHDKWLICSLVHKFGRRSEKEDDKATEEFIEAMKKSLPHGFKAKGELFVFVDECHRTQSGKLHEAMKLILPSALFIGFTGTPLLKKDKKKSIEVFGTYIHTYKFNEAVNDEVVLDLRYEARDIDQSITNQKKIDEWFEAKTKGLSALAKSQLKQKWGTMQKVLSSQDRLRKIVADILLDMETKPRLMDGHGNAMLVCSSIYQACKCYEMFNQTDLKGKCAIITSYKPATSDITGEESGEGLTEKLKQYEIYRKMLADYFDLPEDRAMGMTEKFEIQVKERFIKEPGQMRLLIVVDKLLTGFDAPSATYLYIDKKMQDHGLFQAICRVNRLDGNDKEYGYIVDYKDLFKRLEGAINDYTGGALDGYDEKDVEGLLSDRLEKGREQLEAALETVKAICEPVKEPRATKDYLHYFCAEDTSDKDALQENEPKRVALYKAVGSLLRAYSNLANEMPEAGFTPEQIAQVKKDVTHFDDVCKEVKLASADYLDMKLYEPAMRHLFDNYIRADDSETLADFEELGLIDLIVENDLSELQKLPGNIRKDKDSMAETIENNMRKVIIDAQANNPRYYDKMSELLDALIKQRKKEAVDYEQYLQRVKELAGKVVKPEGTGGRYPSSLKTAARRALYDNLNQNEALALKVDQAVMNSKNEGWRDQRFKLKKVRNAIQKALGEHGGPLDAIVELVKSQGDY